MEKNNNNVLCISTKEKGKIFEIFADGSIWYISRGVYRQADTDKKLGIALGNAFKTLVKLNEETLNRQNVHINQSNHSN